MDLQAHMLENVGVSVPDPVINGKWQGGKGKLDYIRYIGHCLPKGDLVRYIDMHSPDDYYVWKEWEGQDIHFDADEYRQRKAEADIKAKAAAEAEEAERTRLLAILQTVITESVLAIHNHPYPLGKRILAIGARQATKRYQIAPATEDKRAQYVTPDDCLIPVYDHDGNLQGIQQITSTGYKLMRGTFKDGLLWVGGGLTTGEVLNRLYIAEGWATGVAVHMRTRNPVVVAFATSNLLPAGKWARGRYPDAELIFAVDNDIGSTIKVQGRQVENPGKYYATLAALAVNAAVITPPGDSKSDWCDWHYSQIAGKKTPDCLAA